MLHLPVSRDFDNLLRLSINDGGLVGRVQYNLLRFGVTSRARNERSIFEAVVNSFDNKLNESQPDLNDAADRDRQYDIVANHIALCTQTLASIASQIVHQEVAASVKLLWRNEQEVAVRTISRNPLSLTRERELAPNFYSYKENTAFSSLIHNPECPIYSCENLSAAFARGDYKNSHSNWPYLYNSTLVSRMPSYSGKNSSGVIGFVCLDTKFSNLDNIGIRRTVQLFEHHFHDVFKYVTALSAIDKLDLSPSSGFEPDFFIRLGYSSSGEEPAPIDNKLLDLFEAGVDALLSGKNALAEAERDRVSAQLAFNSNSENAGQEEEPMGRFSKFDVAAMFEDVLGLEESKKIEEAAKMSDQEFESILEEVAEENPYADKLIKASKAARARKK